MNLLLKKQKKEIGLSPDSLYFRGKKKMDRVLMRIIDFDASNLEEIVVQKVDEVLNYKDRNTVTWFNIDGLHDESVMEKISESFQFDSLILANVMDTEAPPRIQEFEKCIFISIKMMKFDENKVHASSVENLSLILTDKVLISFQESKGDVFEPVRERIRAQKKRIRSSAADYLTFALLDIVIDNYIYILGVLGEKIENIEENLLADPNQSTIDEINNLKRELNYIRKNILPAKEMILALSKIDSELIDERNDIHYKELLDNITHATDVSNNFREILSDQLNVYHTTMSTKLNDIIKFLTVFSVIFIPLTFIAGIYGTNFEVLPELHFKYSYFIMWGVIISIAIIMLFYFKRKRWL